MRYFTPELIARGQVKDHDLLDRHEEEWDRACERYEATLQAVLPHMPPGLKQIQESYYLHDARVLSMGRRGSALVLVLHLDTPPQSILSFTYDLISEPQIVEEALPAEARFVWSPPLWLYNEIEQVTGASDGWREHLLLSNGWEITISFRDVKVEEFDAILPAHVNGAIQQAAAASAS